MTPTMTVVHTARTGHVVGALSGVGIPAALDVTALIGTALVLHQRTDDHITRDLPLPAELLQVAAVPNDERVFTDTSSYAVVRSATDVATVEPLNSWGAAAHPVELTATGVKITVPVSVATDTPLLVVVSDGGEPLLGTITANSDTVELPASLASGDHAALLMVSGRRALLVVESVP
jgi:hypothetical protein